MTSKIRVDEIAAATSGSTITVSGSTVIGRAGLADTHNIYGTVNVTGSISASSYYGNLTVDMFPHTGDVEITGAVRTTQNITASGIVSASSFYGDGSNLTNVTAAYATGYPFDLRPNSTNISTTSEIVEGIGNTTGQPLRMIGSLYSPSTTVQIISSSANVSASIINQTYVNNNRFDFTLAASASTVTAAPLKIAVQTPGYSDETPQILNVRYSFDLRMDHIAGNSLWLDADDTSTVTTYSCSPTGSAITGALALPDCQLWLDASDASTITLNGSTVSQWNDKSGNGNHAAQTTAGNQPLYDTNGWTSYDGSFQKNALLFNGSTTFFENIVACNTTSRTIFVVFKPNPSTQYSGIFHCNPNNSYGGVFLHWNNGENNYFGASGAWRLSNVPSFWQSAGSSYYQHPSLASFTMSPTRLSLRADSDDTWSTFGSYTIDTGGSLQIGKWSSYEFGGYMAEFILYDRELNLDEQQRVENYLRDKWGTTPITTKVKQWSDKSGLGNHGTAYSPARSPNAYGTTLNGRKTLDFDQNKTTYLSLPDNSVLYPSEEFSHIFAVVKRKGDSAQRDWGAWLGLGEGTWDTFTGIHDTQKHSVYLGDGGLTPAESNTTTNTVATYLLESEVSGTTVSFYRNGNADGTATISPNGDWGVMNNSKRYVGAIEAARTNHSYLHANLAEVLVFTASLNTTERADIVNFLKEKWGIT